MKKVLITLMAVALLVTGAVGLVACNKSDFKDAPVSVSSSVRWAEDGKVYLDIDIANKVDDTAKQAKFYLEYTYVYTDANGNSQEKKENADFSVTLDLDKDEKSTYNLEIAKVSDPVETPVTAIKNGDFFIYYVDLTDDNDWGQKEVKDDNRDDVSKEAPHFKVTDSTKPGDN